MANNKYHMESHHFDAMAENADWLMNDVGLDADQVARRLGVRRDALEKLLERRKHGGHRDTNEGTRSGQGA